MLTLLSIAIIIVTIIRASVNITINVLLALASYLTTALIKLKTKHTLRKLTPVKFELHPDLTKD